MPPRLKLTLALYVAMFALAFGECWYVWCALPGNPPMPSLSAPPPNTNRYYLSLAFSSLRPQWFQDGTNLWEIQNCGCPKLRSNATLIVNTVSAINGTDYWTILTNVVLRSSNHSYGKSYPLTWFNAAETQTWTWPNDWIPPLTNFLEVLASGALFVCSTSVLGTRSFTTNRHFSLDQSRDYGFATTNGVAPKLTMTNNRPNLAVFMHRQ